MPKLKGFSNYVFKKEYNIVNISDLTILVGKWITTIDKEVLLSNRIIRNKNLWIKLLGDWELSSKVIVKVEKASNSARQAVEKAWGEIELITK
jgi:large subunit ribosomal protein L15